MCVPRFDVDRVVCAMQLSTRWEDDAFRRFG